MPTVSIKSDRITLAALTSDPASLSEGDLYYRSDLGKVRFVKLVDTTPTPTDLLVSPVQTADIADGAVTEAKIADGAVSTAKIADGAVTDAKITGPISPGKIGTGDLDLGTGTLSCGTVNASTAVNVGDLIFKNGWKITEHPKYGLVLVSPNGRRYALQLREIRD